MKFILGQYVVRPSLNLSWDYANCFSRQPAVLLKVGLMQVCAEAWLRPRRILDGMTPYQF